MYVQFELFKITPLPTKYLHWYNIRGDSVGKMCQYSALKLQCFSLLQSHPVFYWIGCLKKKSDQTKKHAILLKVSHAKKCMQHLLVLTRTATWTIHASYTRTLYLKKWLNSWQKHPPCGFLYKSVRAIFC